MALSQFYCNALEYITCWAAFQYGLYDIKKLQPLAACQHVIVWLQANEDELNSRHSHLPTVLQVGHDLIKADNFGSEKIQNRIDNIEEQWKNLLDLANFRRRRLMQAVDFYQVEAAVYLISLFLLVCE